MPPGQKYCQTCAAVLDARAVICPRCGVRQPRLAGSGGISLAGLSGDYPKSRVTAAVLAIVLGGLGAHRWYFGQWLFGLIYAVFFPIAWTSSGWWRAPAISLCPTRSSKPVTATCIGPVAAWASRSGADGLDSVGDEPMTSLDRRKELRAQYEQRAREAGVYALRNRVTGRILISSSPDLGSVRNKLEFARATNSPSALDGRLTAEVRELGIDAFVLDVLEVKPEATAADVQSDLSALEDLWREKLADTPQY